MAGGSGYVLSKAALSTFDAEVKNPKACLDPGFEWGGEDVRMGAILLTIIMLMTMLMTMPMNISVIHINYCRPVYDQVECDSG